MTTRSFTRSKDGRFTTKIYEDDIIFNDLRTELLLKGLISHVQAVEGLYKKSKQHTDRRAYLALCADLNAVYDCFESLRFRPRNADGQLELFSDTFERGARGEHAEWIAIRDSLSRAGMI